MESIKIYSSARCPYAQRTRMLMIEKEIPFELTEVDLRNKPDWFLAVSPYGKVPVIVDDGQTIYESAIINEYLDEKYTSIPMMPEEPVERAKARIWMDYCTNKYLTLSRKLLTDNGNDELQSQNKEKLNKNYTIVNSILKATSERPEIKIDWRIYTKNPENPLIRDLIIEGLSLARTQKEEFASILNSNDGDIKALFKTLENFTKN